MPDTTSSSSGGTFDPDAVGSSSGTNADGGGSGDGAAGSGDGGAIDIGPKPDGAACGASSTCLKDHPDTPFCDSNHQVCVECLVDFHCKSKNPDKPVCKGGKCGAIACVPGTKACKADWIEVCNATGDGFDIDVCPDEKPTCVVDKCLKCKPNEVYCKAPENGGQSLAVMLCNADGTASDIKQVCPGQQVCNDAKCGVCTPGAKQCSEHTAQICSSDGTKWETLDDCGSKGLTCLGGLCVNPCAGDFKSNTHVGCDYWAVDLDNAKEGQYDAQNKQFAVVITNTSSQETNVTVKSMATNPPTTKTFKVGAKQLFTIKLPNVLGLPTSQSNQDGTNINKRVYNIKADQPIVAYQFNPLDNYGVFSNDASLLLPRASLGKNYYIVSRRQVGNSLRSYMTVIAVEPGSTKVTVWPSAPTLGGPGVPAMKKGDKKEFTLTEGQVLNIETNKDGADLTGSVVKADKPVAVFGGSEASRSPDIGNCVKYQLSSQKVCASTTNGGALTTKYCSSHNNCPWSCCADHLEEQLFPVKSWGTTYVGAHLRRRGIEKDSWRIVAATNNTKVTVQPNIGVADKTINEGEWFEFESEKDFVITASNPVMVAQYMASSYATVTWENPSCNTDADCKTKYGFDAKCTPTGLGQKSCAPIGDPSLLLNMATSQYLDDYIFLVPDKYKTNYVTIVAPAGAAVTMDNLTIAPQQFQVIPGQTWAVARMPIAAGDHKLTSTKKVGVWVYGYDDDVSYGYAAGAKL